MTKIMKECILNTEVIAVNQDHMAAPGDTKISCGTKAYVRYLSNKTVAVAIPNLSESKNEVSVCFKDLGWSSSTASVRDLWKMKDVGTFTDKYTATLEAYDTLFVILKSATQ